MEKDKCINTDEAVNQTMAAVTAIEKLCGIYKDPRYERNIEKERLRKDLLEIASRANKEKQ